MFIHLAADIGLSARLVACIEGVRLRSGTLVRVLDSVACRWGAEVRRPRASKLGASNDGVF